MTDTDYQNLELLLSKLHTELNAHSFCILPGHIQDGYYIALYDKSGHRFKEIAAISIKDAVHKSKTQ